MCVCVCVQEYGIPAHYGLLSSLGAGMMVVALLSASYHVCPNRLNFQFGTCACRWWWWWWWWQR